MISCTPASASSASSSTPRRRPQAPQLPRVREERHYDNTTSPRDRRLHDPGRRLRARDEAEGHPRSDPERSDNGLKNDRYTGGDGAHRGPALATAQFFINVADNGFLNHTAPSAQGWGYCVFGKVVEGTDVVTGSTGVRTGSATSTPTSRSRTS